MKKNVDVYCMIPIMSLKEPITSNAFNIQLSVGDILQCICGKGLVDEILDDGTKVRLNLSNYDKDNSYLSKSNKVFETEKIEEPVKDNKKFETEKIEEVVEDNKKFETEKVDVSKKYEKPINGFNTKNNQNKKINK